MLGEDEGEGLLSASFFRAISGFCFRPEHRLGQLCVLSRTPPRN